MNCITGLRSTNIYGMNRMKDLFWMAVIVLFAAFSSCSDDKNDGTDEGVEAKLLTFGFYAEDNSSILSDDYIATLSSTTANVTMPAFIDKSALGRSLYDERW